jgi:hypothetical protein
MPIRRGARLGETDPSHVIPGLTPGHGGELDSETGGGAPGTAPRRINPLTPGSRTGALTQHWQCRATRRGGKPARTCARAHVRTRAGTVPALGNH